MQTIFLEDIKDVNKKMLFEVYGEGIQKNAKHYNETIEEIEKAHFDYLTDFLQNKHGFLAVLTDGQRYVAALRVLPKGENNFYCEAFEVVKNERGKGFGKQLYRDVIEHIAKNNDHFKLEAHTWQTNTASIKSHLSVGFKIDKNYVLKEDGSKDDFGVTLCMKR